MKESKKKIEHLIKELRKAKGFSQMQLAEMLGVSYQQVQKYEKGTTKISVERLEQISRALGVPVNIFFPSGIDMVSETIAIYGKITDEEQLLLQLFRATKNKKMRNAVLELLKASAK